MAGNANSGKGPHSDKHSVDGKALIPVAVSAAIGARSFSRGSTPLSALEHEFLSRSLRCDLDEWRKEFGSQLRQAGQELLLLTYREMEKIPPAARAYTLAVLVDKALALEGRSSLQSASVNVTVNNFNGQTPKAAILDALAGRPSPPPSEQPIELQTA